jgi:hypothetical protein
MASSDKSSDNASDETTEKSTDTSTDTSAATSTGKSSAKRTDGDAASRGPRRSPAATVNRVRTLLAQVLWLLFLLAALFLAVGALLITLDANRDNDLVHFILEGANRVDLGVFSKDAGIKQFGGSNAETKNALFNWGIGAVAWLVVGRIVDRIVKP